MAAKRLFKALICLLMVASQSVDLYSQIGKEFWFVAPDVTVSHGDNPIALRLTAMDQPVKVTISMPANSAFTPIVVNIAAYKQFSVKSDDATYSAIFNKGAIENQPKNTVNNKGLLITSEGGDISAYYEVLMSNNPDIFTLKGLNALGKEFYVPSQNAFPNHPYTGSTQTQPYEQVNIVATEDNTSVTITPSAAIQGGASGTPVNIVLNKGQTYSILASDWQTGTFTLGGTQITSDKNIAVTISDDSIEQWASAGSWDLIGDQIVPTSIIGTEYVAIKTSNKANAVNKVYILAVEDNTSVTIDSNSPIALNKGQIKEVDISGSNSAYIKSTKAVYAYQVSGLWNNNGNEMGSALLPTISCTGSTRVSFTRNFAKSFWVQMLVQGRNLGKFKMYNQSGAEVTSYTTALNSMTWNKVTATDKGVPDEVWYTATVDMTIAPFSIGTQSYSIENTQGLFHLSVLDENNGSLSYGYYSSYSTVQIEPPSKMCLGTVVRLESKYPNGSFYWKSSLTGNNIISTNTYLDVTQSGMYWLYMSNSMGCIAKDSIDVELTAPVYDLGDPISACPGESYTLSVPNGYTSYLWSTGETTPSISVTPKANETISISVSVYDSQGCSKADDVTVISAQEAKLDLTHVSSQVCEGDTIRNNTSMIDYIWEVNGVHVPAYDGKNYVVASTTGSYKVTGKSLSGCEATETLTITVNPLPTFVLADKTVCPNTAISFAGPVNGSIVKYQWSQDLLPVDASKSYTSSTFSVTQPGKVWLEVTDGNGCKAKASATPSWYPATAVDIGYYSSVVGSTIYPNTIFTCPENAVSLTATGGFVNYVWTVNGIVRNGVNGASLTNVTVTSGGTTTVKVDATDANGCMVTDQLVVSGYSTPVLGTDKTEYCVGEAVTPTANMERYEWSLAGTVLSTDASYVPTQSGTYTLRGWDANNCSSATVQFVVNPLPVVGISGTPVCANSPYVFTGSSSIAGTYLWSQENVPVDPAKNYTSSTFNATKQGAVWLEVTTAKGCKSKATATPTWNPMPSVDITYYLALINETISSDEAYICPLSKIVLTGNATSPGSATLTYSWTVDGVFAGNGNTLEVQAPVTGQRVVELLLTDGNGCSATDKVTVYALESPISLLNTLKADICLGEELSIESIRSSVLTHQWEYLADGTLYTDYTFTPTKSGVYRLTVWNKNNCSDYKDFTVHDPAVVIAAPGNAVKECANSSHQFQVMAQPHFDYIWSRDQAKTDVVGSGTSYVATTPGTYWVSSLSTDVAGCQSQAQVSLAWHPSKLVDVGTKLTVCSTGLPIDLTADPQMSNYQWYLNGSPVATTNTYTVTQQGHYTVTADYLVGGANCALTQDFDVEVLAVLPSLVMNKSEFCANEDLVLTAVNGFSSYQWYKVVGGVDVMMAGETNNSLKVGSSGDYKLIALQSNGCSSEGVVTVAVTDLPVLNLDISDNTACKGNTITVENKTTDPRTYTYSWSLNGSEVGNANPLVLPVNRTETYLAKATVVDVSGKTCSVEQPFTVSVPVPPTVVLADETICSNSCLALSSKFNPASVGGLVDYDWYFNGSLLSKTACVNQAGIYTLRINVNNLGIDCQYDYTLNLNVVAAPTFTGVTDPAPICAGSKTVLDAGADYFAYKWSYSTNPSGTPVAANTFPNTRTIDVKDDGYYRVQAWTTYGSITCTDQSNLLHLVVNPNPTLTFTKSSAYLCDGGSVTLNATNTNSIGQPTQYEWANSGIQATNGDYTTLAAGTFTVRAIDANHCQLDSAITVEAYTVTPITVAALPQVCDGQSVQLPAIANVYQYQWFFNNDGNAQQGLVNQPWSVTVGGNYVVSYLKESYGCPALASTVVTVNPLPAVALNASYSPVCDGTVVPLDAGGSYPLYQWTQLGQLGNPNVVVGNDKLYNAAVTGNYQVQIWTLDGCTSSGTANVVVNPNPVVRLGADFSVCPGTQFQLDVQNASSLTGFLWSTGAADNGLPSIKSSIPGVYTVRAFDLNGCFADDTISVTNYVPVDFDLPVVSPICDNTTYTLKSPLAVPAQATSYQWFYNNVGNAVQGSINSDWTVSSPGNYLLDVTDLNGCKVAKAQSLATIPAPNFDLGADREGCYFDTLRIVAKNTYVRYMWNNDPSDDKYYKMVDPAITHYSLEVEDRNGCVATRSVNYVAHPLPVFSLGTDVTKCAGFVTTLSVPSSYPSILWSTGATASQIDVGQGDYWAKVTDGYGCSSTDDIRVNWLPSPAPDLGPDTLICPLNDLLIDAGQGFTSYKWHSGAITQSIIANVVDTVNTVTVSDMNGCVGWDSKLVYKMDTPELKVASDTTLCANYTLVLDAGTTYPIVNWSTGETTSSIEVSKAGSYWVRATDGCLEVKDTVAVAFYDTPVIAVLDTMIYAQIAVLAQGGTQPYLYSLNSGKLQKENVFESLKNGTYEVYVEDVNGCYAMDTVSLSSTYDIEVPPFFTPNGDGYNDVWAPGGLERFPEAEILVFDRYGKQVARLTGSTPTWDGYYLGKPLASDDYWYVINLVQVKKIIKGNVTLKR